jgi:hypothetical protein
VSTKAGLDYNSVWLAWGKASLKAGAWTDARDKFAHCSPHKKDTQMLSDILQILQVWILSSNSTLKNPKLCLKKRHIHF